MNGVLLTRSMMKGRDAGAFAVFLCLDLLSKALFSSFPESVCNGSGPWGAPVGGGLMIAIAVVILAAFVVTAFRRFFPGSGIPMALILAGGVGNLFDRVAFGCVRDYPFVAWLYAFNMADVWLSIGAIWLLFRLTERERSSEPV